MNLNRRDVLIGGTSATLLAASRAFANTDPTATEIVATPSDVQLVSGDGPETALWTYGGSVPGSVIRVRRGDRVVRQLTNALPQATTIHWHGIRIDHAMDGVPGISQPPVPPGSQFLYDFAANDAGTYWYHSHVRSWEQVARGLSGALIIDEHAPPDVDQDEILVLDDWRLDQYAQLDESFGSMRDWSHSGRIGNFVTVNGLAAHGMTVRRNARMRLRLINAANARIFTIGMRGLTGSVVALDGQPLETPEPMNQIRLAPAQRADIIVDVTEAQSGEAFLISHERDGDYALTTFAVDAAERKTRREVATALQLNDVPTLGNLTKAVHARLQMSGGAMGNMRSAMLNGVDTEIQELVRKGKAWAFNGVAGHDQNPLLELKLGQTALIDLSNDTRWPHAMHLHGHHFRQVLESGQIGPLRDTLLLDAGQTAQIAFVADNPGDWLFHCHMLEHAAAGMSTLVRVV